MAYLQLIDNLCYRFFGFCDCPVWLVLLIEVVRRDLGVGFWVFLFAFGCFSVFFFFLLSRVAPCLCVLFGFLTSCSNSRFFLTQIKSFLPPWLGRMKHFLPTNHRLPYHIILIHRPFTPLNCDYGVDLFEDDYRFLRSTQDFTMDPVSRPSSLVGCVRLPLKWSV
jgi:hypothetical protein